MRLFLLLLFTGLYSFSQQIFLDTQYSLQNAVLHPESDELVLYFENYLEAISLEDLSSEIRPLAYDQNVRIDHDPLSCTAFHFNGKDLFVHGSGGLVYQVSNDTLKRLDNSFNYKMDYGAVVFVHNNILHKYGGYGYWSVRDFFTYFDTNINEWEVLGPVDSENIPDGITSAQYYKDDNDLYIFSGYTVDKETRKNRVPNNEIWRFDLDKKKWHFMGSHIPATSRLRLVMNDKLLLIRPYDLVLIDVLGNNMQRFEHSAISAKEVVIHHATYHKGKFYLILFYEGNTILQIVEEKDFFGRLSSETKFYTNKFHWAKTILTGIAALALFAIGILLFIKYLKKRKKISIIDNGLRYRNKFVEFDQESLQILQLLTRSDEVPSGDILKIVEKGQYSHAHNERIKVQKIKDINLKLKTLVGTQDDLIKNHKSPDDRRIRLFSLSQEYFF